MPVNELNSARILLVEDNPADLLLLQRTLHQAKVFNPLDVARDGAEALEMVFGEGEHAGRSLEMTPGLILLDLRLPKIDGLEVIGRLKAEARTRAIPIIVLTGSADFPDVAGCLGAGVVSYIVKPLTLPALVETLAPLGFTLRMSDSAPGKMFISPTRPAGGGVSREMAG